MLEGMKQKSQLKEKLVNNRDKTPKTKGFVEENTTSDKKFGDPSQILTTMRKAMSMEGPNLADLNKETVKEEDTSNEIDFNQMLDKYRKRTEHRMPFIKMEIKDTMFLDNSKVVCLEYIYYSKEGDYSNLMPRDNKIPHIFGKMNNEANEGHYNTNPQCFDDSLEDFIQLNKMLMTDENDIKIEILLSIWGINSRGQLIKDKETNIVYKQPLRNIKNLNVKLQLSNDSKYILLPIFLEDHKYSRFGNFKFKYQKLELQAWKTDNLKAKKFPKHLTEQLKKIPPLCKIGQLESIKLGSRNKYLVLKFKTNEEANFLIFSTMTGECCNLCFQFNIPIRQYSDGSKISHAENDVSNGFKRVSQTDNGGNTFDIDEYKEDRYLVDVLIDEDHQYNDNESDSSFEECDIDTFGYQTTMQIPRKFDIESANSLRINGTQSHRTPSPKPKLKSQSSSMHMHSNRDSLTLADALIKMKQTEKDHVHEIAKSYELKLTIFYIGNVKNGDVEESLVFGCYQQTLSDILGDTEKEQAHDLNHFGFPTSQDLGKTFLIPRDWFLTRQSTFKKWQNCIYLSANKNCTKIGVLNKEMGQYIGYDLEERETIVHHKLNQNMNQITEHVRNQETKQLLMLNVRNIQETRTDVLISQSEILSINFQTKFNLTMQDTQVIENSGKVLLQSIKANAQDHEIIMKTQVPTSDNSKDYHDETRKSISQRIVGSHPVILYNIGISRLIIQIFPCKGNQLILQLPENENFINFIEFNDLEDLGIEPSGLNIETCSRFAFLTEDVHEKMRINVLLVDPYHSESEICLFRSNKVFDIGGRNTRDTSIKNIVVNTGKQIKMICQLRYSLHQFVLEEEEPKNDLIGHKDKLNVLQQFLSKANTQQPTHTEEFMYLGCAIPMKLSPEGDIYCILRQTDGLHQILQINKDGLSTNMCDMQEICVNFDIEKDIFYYLTDQQAIYMLELQQANNRLVETNVMQIKPTDPCNEVTQSGYAVGNMIIRDKYLIFASCTYYLYEGNNCEDKLMKMEQLTVDHKLQDEHLVYDYALGPYMIEGSDTFACVFESIDEDNQPIHQFHISVHQLPDSQTQILVQDHQHLVTLSTFLNEKEILVQIKNKFLLFNEDGIFQQEIHFSDTDKNIENLRLIGMSENGYFFMFENQIDKTLSIYKLPDIDDQYETFSIGKKRFDLYYKVDFLSKLEKHENQHKCKSVSRESMICVKNVNNYGEIIVTQCKQKKSELNEWTKMIIIVFKFALVDEENNDSKGEQCICDIVYFKKNALKDLYDVFNQLKFKYTELKQIAELSQKRLPVIIRDYTESKEFQSQIDYLNGRFEWASSAKLFDDLIIVNCGRWMQYAIIKFDEHNDFDKQEKVKFKKVPIRFNKTVEICLFKKVCDDFKHTVQIIGKNVINQVLTIITYDFDQMIEQTIFQVKFQGDFKAERMILNGLNEKFNYLSNGQVIYDLEYNIPMQKLTVITGGIISSNSNSQNSKKLYSDTSRCLDIMNKNQLTFPTTKMDLLFWQGVNTYEIEEDVIVDNVMLEEFAKVYDGKSLFHHFHNNTSLIQLIHKKFMEEFSDDGICDLNELMPITILHPDQNGKTALNWAINSGTLDSFELMIAMITKVPNNQLITKMMLDIFPQMVSNTSEELLRFFDSCTFRPLSVAYPLIVEWPQGLDEHIYSSPTILITAILIEDEFVLHEMLIRKEKIEEEIEDLDHPAEDSQIRSRELMVGHSHCCRTHERVIVEACDFDWIFIKDNAAQLILLLQTQANPLILNQKSIRLFIEIMWKQYESVLVRNVLVPFCLYLVMFVILVAQTAWIDPLKPINEASDSDQSSQAIVMMSFACAALIAWLIFLELCALSVNWKEYLTDTENALDLAYMVATLTYLYQIHREMKGESDLSAVMVRSHGGIACFLLWLRLYQFFRLFPQTAHYIRLTVGTLHDIKIFAYLSGIIVLAFANFFFVIGSNIDTEQNATFFDEHLGFRPLDAMIQSYLVFIGKYSIDRDSFMEAPNRNLATFGFLMMSFISYVVLLQMLIPIMQATYTRVSEEATIYEQQDKVNSIASVLWLRDLKKEFQNSKYIIRISREHICKQEDEVNVNLNVTQSKDEIKKVVEDRFRSLEKNVDLMMKRQQIIMEKQNIDKSEQPDSQNITI